MIEEGDSYSVKHSIVYKWKINEITSFLDAAKYSKNEEEISSPKFSTGAKIKDSWNLKLKVAKDSESKSWISVYFESNIDTKVRATFAIFILNKKEEPMFVNQNDILFNVIDPQAIQFNRFFGHVKKSWGTLNFVKINELLEKKDEFLSNNTLKLCAHLTVYDEYVEINNQIGSLVVSKGKLSEDFQELLISKKNSDVVILVGDKKFDAHKFILTTRSCVFEAMFSYDMKEKKENEITIIDIDGEVFEKLLEYIYTDKVEDLDIFAEGLLEASDKYQLQGLKEICEDSLARNISIENAIRVLILADRHSAKQLKEVVDNYVVSNFVKFKNTEDFKALKESQSPLFFAIVEKYAIKY